MQTSISLEGGGTASVVHFDFKAMVKSLLGDPELMREENLVLPPNPLGIFPPPHSFV